MPSKIDTAATTEHRIKCVNDFIGEEKYKQKHSVAGHTYKHVCGRGCYLITRPGPWVRCECTEK